MAPEPLLTVENLTVRYDGVPVVHDLDFVVPRGAIVAIIGPNGAGKTTTLRGIGSQAEATGRVVFDGRDISRIKPWQVARLGLAQVPQGRRLFPQLTVAENLALGTYARPRPGRLDQVHELFPVLAERANQRAAALSGGEQQMVAIGRALMNGPLLIVMDEPSLGLAPILVGDLFETIGRIRSLGVSVLLVEQNATQALNVSDHVLVIDRGRSVYQGTAEDAANELDLIAAYIG